VDGALLERRGVEVDGDVPFLDLRAVLDELDDLELAARLQGRSEHDRFRGPDVAADLDVIDEITARDDRGGDSGHRPGSGIDRDPRAGGDDDDGGADRQPRGAGPGHRADLAASGDAPPALRAIVTPSWSPLVTTASCVLVAPSVTAWRSRRPPRWTMTTAFSPSTMTESRGTTRTPLARS